LKAQEILDAASISLLAAFGIQMPNAIPKNKSHPVFKALRLGAAPYGSSKLDGKSPIPHRL